MAGWTDPCERMNDIQVHRRHSNKLVVHLMDVAVAGSLCLSTVVVADSQAAVVGSALRASVGYLYCTTLFAHCLLVVLDYNFFVDSLLRNQSGNCNRFVVSLLCRFVDPTAWLELGTVTDSCWVYQRRSGRTLAHLSLIHI